MHVDCVSAVVFLEKLVLVAFILGITFISAKIIRKFMDAFEKKSSVHDNTELINYKFFKHFVEGVIYFLGVCLAISTFPSLRSIALSLFASSGVIAVIIGFASQQAFSNIISGIFLGIFKPFVAGSRIQVKNISGVVDDITLRHTIIKTDENKNIMIPNALLNSEIIENGNWPDDYAKSVMDVYISYDSNIDKAMTIIKSVIQQNPYVLRRRSPEMKEHNALLVEVFVIKLRPHYIHLRGTGWTKNEADAFKLMCESYKAIKEQFDQEGIKFPHMCCQE